MLPYHFLPDFRIQRRRDNWSAGPGLGAFYIIFVPDLLAAVRWQRTVLNIDPSGTPRTSDSTLNSHKMQTRLQLELGSGVPDVRCIASLPLPGVGIGALH